MGWLPALRVGEAAVLIFANVSFVLMQPGGLRLGLGASGTCASKGLRRKPEETQGAVAGSAALIGGPTDSTALASVLDARNFPTMASLWIRATPFPFSCYEPSANGLSRSHCMSSNGAGRRFTPAPFYGVFGSGTRQHPESYAYWVIIRCNISLRFSPSSALV